MKKFTTILAVGMATIFAGCYVDNEEELYPGGGGDCDLTNISYSGTIVPLLQSNGCLGCHSGGAPSGNISLEGYTNVMTAARNGKLYGAINHSPGFSPMPKGGSKMTACNISKIKAWIDAGSVNN